MAKSEKNKNLKYKIRNLKSEKVLNPKSEIKNMKYEE